MSGKWHLGEAPRHWPTRYGFDRYFGLISGASSYYTLREDEPLQRRMALDDQPWQPPPAGFYMTEAFSQQAVDYLHGHTREQPQAPFFLYLSYTAPHWPLHAPEEAIAPYRQVYAAGAGAIAGRRAAHLGAAPPAVVDADPDSMAVYAAQVTLADEGVGVLSTRCAEQAGWTTR
jgi:arylsulfatase